MLRFSTSMFNCTLQLFYKTLLYFTIDANDLFYFLYKVDITQFFTRKNTIN